MVIKHGFQADKEGQKGTRELEDIENVVRPVDLVSFQDCWKKLEIRNMGSSGGNIVWDWKTSWEQEAGKQGFKARWWHDTC